MQKYGKRKWTWPLALALLAPASLLAAGTATLNNGIEINELVWLDPQTVRVDRPAEQGYMVLRDGKIYTVNPQATGGMPPVMELSGLIQGMANSAITESDALFSQEIESIRPTGKTEIVAGITGNVHVVVLKNHQNQTESKQIVLTDDPLAVEMTAAYFTLIGALIGPERATKLTDALPGDQRGLLRVGDDLVVQTIGADVPATEAFELPAEPMSMDNLMQELMKRQKR